LFLSDSSREEVGSRQGERSTAALARCFVCSLVIVAVVGFSATAPAQTPGTGQTQESQPQQQQQQQTQPAPTQPAQPEVQQAPLQQYQIQQPGRPGLTPATPPSTTLPVWTPPVPPPPSQTNIPAPIPGTPAPVPGAPGFVGVPPLTLPGAFAPAVAVVRGATLEFHPTLRLSGEYSDNFFQTTTGAEDNFRTTLGPGFQLLLNGARTFGTLATTVDLVHDTAPNTGDDVKVFPSATATVRYAFTPRLALTVSDTYIRNDEPVAADAFGIRRGRRTFDSNTFGLTGDWVLERTALQAYYRNVLFINEDDNQGNQGQTGGEFNDTITNILGLNASGRIGAFYILRGGYEFSKTDSINGGGDNGGDDNTSHTGFAAVSRQIGLYGTGGVQTSYSFQTNDSTKIWNASIFGAYGLPTGLSLSGSVGYSILNSDTQDNEGTVSANVNASYRFTRAVISVGAFQDYRQTAQTGENFGTVETRAYFGSFLYQLTPFINAIVFANYSENEGTGTGNNQGGGTQKTLSYGGSVNWQILRWLTSSLQYRYTKQTGNSFDQNVGGGNGDYAENRVTLTFFATF
jgi:hypothetical protein